MKVHLAVIILALLLCSTLRAADPVTIHYAFDEKDGNVVRDGGAIHADGRLSVAPTTPVLDAYFEVKEWDRWYPILRNGLQIKGIREGSDGANTGGDVPIVAKRGEDYEIDYAGGRAKASAAGRIEAGTTPTFELRYANAGPSRCAGHKGRALSFDGLDDAVECGEPLGMDRLSSFQIELWVQTDKNDGREPLLLSKGNGLQLGIDRQRRLFMKHQGLKAADETPATVTTAKDPLDVAPERWRKLRAFYDGSRVMIEVDGKAVATQEHLTGLVSSRGTLRLSGPTDPHFFAGRMDEVAIQFNGPDVRPPDTP